MKCAKLASLTASYPLVLLTLLGNQSNQVDQIKLVKSSKQIQLKNG